MKDIILLQVENKNLAQFYILFDKEKKIKKFLDVFENNNSELDITKKLYKLYMQYNVKKNKTIKIPDNINENTVEHYLNNNIINIIDTDKETIILN